jgi:wobble nucleotide-excising tRNase
MIESIRIKNTATYGDTAELITALSKLNFFFGSNGSGKTTITRIIANENRFPSCEISWKGGTKLEPMVYNRDFIEENFNQTPDLKGIFTLGENNVTASEKINVANAELNAITKKIESLNFQLSGNSIEIGKTAELAALEESFANKCWTTYSKHKTNLGQAFEGVRNSKDKFKERVLHERGSTVALKTLTELEHEAQTIFGTTPVAENTVSRINAAPIINLESNPILSKRVLGKADVDIAAMITTLGNSDWVRQGRIFYKANDSVCPFCQQITELEFAKNLDEYFDDVFEKDSKAIQDLITNYTSEYERLRLQIDAILANASKFIAIEKLKAEKELLDSRLTINTQQLAIKKNEPSRAVALESIDNIASSIANLIDEANLRISRHNDIVANITKERSELTSQVWKFFIDVELKNDLTAYDAKKNALSNVIAGMQASMKTEEEKAKLKRDEIYFLEKNITSIQPSIDEINKLLSSFGFRGFSLTKAEDDKGYKIIRKDRSDAKESLSEGEKTFVTFLYFYHLLKGGYSESGVTTNRVVVFDDPVSSLDSDILFIVSTLIKNLFSAVRSGAGQIKQILVFTHNVYFHKEVSFDPSRGKNTKLKDETFWIVRKSDFQSTLVKYDNNPIKTSYDLLWDEVRKKERQNLTLQNTLRRILEYYFKILGGIDPDMICEKFQGEEKFICKSLFSWINDGSHSAFEDAYISIEDGSTEIYLKVFKAVFVNTNHLEHYKMMMGNAYVDEAEAADVTP